MKNLTLTIAALVFVMTASGCTKKRSVLGDDVEAYLRTSGVAGAVCRKQGDSDSPWFQCVVGCSNTRFRCLAAGRETVACEKMAAEAVPAAALMGSMLTDPTPIDASGS